MTEISLQLSSEQVNTIIGFLGYGNPSASVWFIGIEEGLGLMNSEDALRNLTSRGNFEEAMDLREAHSRLLAKGRFIDLEKSPPPTQVWKWMAKIMRARQGHNDWTDPNLAKQYVQFRLGRSDGETFLTELFPIPAAGRGDRRWLNQFRKLCPELDNKIKQRRQRLSEVLTQTNPLLVVCYGMRLADQFAQLLSSEWCLVSRGIQKSSDSRYLLLPFFGQGHMSHDVVRNLIDLGLLRPTAG